MGLLEIVTTLLPVEGWLSWARSMLRITDPSTGASELLFRAKAAVLVASQLHSFCERLEAHLPPAMALWVWTVLGFVCLF